MKPLRFERQLRLHDLESFRVREDYLGPTVCFLLIVDHGRPTTLDDFPYLKGIEDPNEFGRDNYIQAIALHDRPLGKEEKEEIANLAGMFLEWSGHFDWNIVFEPLPAEEVRRMEHSLPDMLTVFDRVLRQHGVSIDLAHINEKHLARLSQD